MDSCTIIGAEGGAMQTYTTIHGQAFDLSALSDEERLFLAEAVSHVRGGMAFGEFLSTYVNGRANPLVAAADGWVSEAVWRHPLYRALRDLGARLGTAQGELSPEGA